MPALTPARMFGLMPFRLHLKGMVRCTTLSRPCSAGKKGTDIMDLGIFSVSLAVKDIKASRRFYETLGFKVEHGEEAQKWLIMACGTAKVGLFEGMFDDNILTFNPPDARAVEKKLKDAGYAIDKETEGDEGPCHTVLRDPDGNLVMFDQF